MVVLLFDVHFSTNDWIRLTAILGMFFLYIFVFFMIGVFVSSLTHRSRVSFLYLLVIWVCFVMIIPKVAVMIAEQITNVPAKHQVDTRKRRINISLHNEMDEILQKESQKSNLSRDGYRQRRRELHTAAHEKIEIQQRAVEEEYRKKQRNMVSFAMMLSRISPTSSMVYSTMTLGRTGITEHDRFIKSIREYRGDFRKFFDDYRRKQRDRERRGRENVNTQSVDDFSGFPEYRLTVTPLGISFREVLIDMALLVVFSLIFFMGSYMSFLRYPVAG